MHSYYLAIDIGASSGRHILSHLEDGKIILEEIYRFPNGFSKKGNAQCWDLEALFFHIKEGMKKCKQIGKVPTSVGIDTWAVDFVLLDEKNEIIGDSVAYRDDRTDGMDEVVYQKIPQDKLYERTGIQKQIFNTIYQLVALKEKNEEQLQRAKSLLMIPDYLQFLLTGKKAAEYTNATTTQLVGPDTKEWDDELIALLGLPRHIFEDIVMPGYRLGTFLDSIAKEVGFCAEVIMPATHDTGSAVLAVPVKDENALYISSGTWSLMGIERMKADCSKKSMDLNFTNEGGYDYRFRYLKNIMGLWMIQSVKKEIANYLKFGEICEMAAKESIISIVDCNDGRFLAPSNMTIEVQKACEESMQQVPEGIAQVAAVIYNSLAECYAKTILEIESITGENYQTIHVVGGGANASYLNELTAKKTKRTVLAGPVEATAIGNIMAQMIATNEFRDLQSARTCVYDSFEIVKYEP